MLRRLAVLMFALCAPLAAWAEQPGGEPFGRLATIAPQGPVWVKWEAVEKGIRNDEEVLRMCVVEPAHCPAAAIVFLAIIDDARARVGLDKREAVNRAVNLAIRFSSDQQQHGAADVWSSPLATFRSGFGDCEDFAIAKYVALGAAGVPPSELRLAIVRQGPRKYHMVLAARLDRHWLILDMLRSQILEDIATDYVPRFVIDYEGIREFQFPHGPVADASAEESLNTGTSCN